MRCATCQASTVRHSWYCFRCQLAGKAVLPKLVVGIGGRAQHGKTTVAETMAAELLTAGFTSFFCSVSDLVLAELHSSREVGSQYDRMYASQPQGKWLIEKLIAHGRRRRAKDEDYWLDKLTRFWLERRVQRSKDEDATDRADVLIVTLRFPNELRWVEQSGGITIRVIREGFVSSDRPSDDDMETSLDDERTDFEIRHRDGQLAWLKGQAQALVRSVLL